MDQLMIKLRRARSRLERLKSALDEYDAAGNLGLREGRYLVVNRRPDPEWALDVSEIAHHVRSVLDQAVAMLALSNGVAPDKHRGAFPIARTAEGYWTPARGQGRSYRDASTGGVTEPARRIIDGFQPFQLEIPSSHPLALLQDLSNDEKHRLGHPHVTLLRGYALIHTDAVHRTVSIFSHDSGADHHRPGRTDLQDGDDLWALVDEAMLTRALDGLREEGVDVTGDPRHFLTLIPRLGVGFSGQRSLVMWPEIKGFLDFVELGVVPKLTPLITHGK